MKRATSRYALLALATVCGCGEVPGAASPQAERRRTESTAAPAETDAHPAASKIRRARTRSDQESAAVDGDAKADDGPPSLTDEAERELRSVVARYTTAFQSGPYSFAGWSITPGHEFHDFTSAEVVRLIQLLWETPDGAPQLRALEFGLGVRLVHGDPEIAAAFLAALEGDDRTRIERVARILADGVLPAGAAAAGLRDRLLALAAALPDDAAERGALYHALGGVRGVGVDARADLLTAFADARGAARAGAVRGVVHALVTTPSREAGRDDVRFENWFGFVAHLSGDTEVMRVLRTALADPFTEPRKAALSILHEELARLWYVHGPASKSPDADVIRSVQIDAALVERSALSVLTGGDDTATTKAMLKVLTRANGVRPWSDETLARVARLLDESGVTDDALWAIVEVQRARELPLARIVGDAVESGRVLSGAQIHAVRQHGADAARVAPSLLLNAGAVQSYWSSDAILSLHVVAPAYEPAFETYVAATSRPLNEARSHALTALAAFGARAIPHLVGRLADRDSGVAATAASALAAACPQPTDDHAVWTAYEESAGEVRTRLRAWLRERVPDDPRLGD